MEAVLDTSRRRVALLVVPARTTAAVVVPPAPDGGPAYRGYGPVDLVCGACGSVVCAGVAEGMFVSLAFACRCGAVNRRD